MTKSYKLDDLVLCIAREEAAVLHAKCESSRNAHIGLADRYKYKLAQMKAVETAIRISFG